jgi:putative transposase
VTGTLGLSVGAVVHPAGTQNRDGATMVMRSIRKSRPWLRRVFADGSYAGTKLPGALTGEGDWRIEIIKRYDAARGFEVLPCRWVVERTEPWLGRYRRLAKAWQAFGASAEGWLLIACISIMIRCLARFHAGSVGLRAEP